MDSSGNAYVAGSTASVNFPTMNAYQAIKGGSTGSPDAFVTKLNVSGSDLLYSTFLGGSLEDYSYAIAADGNGCAFVTGNTQSTDFPIPNAYQTSLKGSWDAFVARINTTDSGDPSLIYSTYLGGTSESSDEKKNDQGWGIAVDGSGNAYVTGWTDSTDFPTLNPYQGILKGACDAFVTKIDTTKSASASLIYSTYLGGTDDPTMTGENPNEQGRGIAVDSSGNAYVAGLTAAADFPTKNPYQSTKDTPPEYSVGASETRSLSSGTTVKDAFVARIDPAQAGSDGLIYSTYLGGSEDDHAYAIAVDSNQNAYVTGDTLSTNFPTKNPWQSEKKGLSNIQNAIVARIDTSQSGSASLIYSTYLGGTGTSDPGLGDFGMGIAQDGNGNAYVTGFTYSTDFPTINPFQGNNAGSASTDAFVAKLSFPLPTVTTTTPSSITSTTASSGGNVSSDGGASVTARGVCWSTSANPTTSDSHTLDGTGTGTFTSSITGLTPGAAYHVRAYATNTAGTAYGSDLSFTTYNTPTISSINPTSGTTGTSVTIYGNNFTGATAVSFGGTAAFSFTVDLITQITATVGTGSTGQVTVTTPGGTATFAGFTFVTSGATITGTVTNPAGEPVPGVSVCAQPFTTGGQTWWCASTGSNGTYAIAAQPGYARVKASGAGYLEEYYDNAYDGNWATPVWVTADQTVPNINFTMGTNGSISGQVLTANPGTPLANVCVYAYRQACATNHYASAQTDANGAYTIANLPPQLYYLRTNAACATPQNYQKEWWNSSGGALVCDQAGAVSVASGQNTPGANFSLDPSDVAYPAPSFSSAGVYSNRTAGGAANSQFYAFINGPSLEDIVSVNATGPSGTYNLYLVQLPFITTGNFYYYNVSGSVVNNGAYTFTVTDSLGRTATVDRSFTYDSNMPVVDANTMKAQDLGNYAYVGTATPTLTWGAVTWPGTQGYYQAIIYDYDGKAIWYAPTTDGTSVAVPAGYLQPDTAYYWLVRTMDIPATGQRGQNRHASEIRYFYTGTKGNPNLSGNYLFSYSVPIGKWSWFGITQTGLAPWDIQLYSVTDPKGSVYTYGNRNYLLWGPMYYYCASNWPPPTPDGGYTFLLKDNDSNQATQLVNFTYNPPPGIPEATRLPADNAYLFTKTPTFSWSAPAAGNAAKGAPANGTTYYYVLRILDYYSKIGWYTSPNITETSFTLPEEVVIKWPPGSYRWQVRIFNGAGGFDKTNAVISSDRTFTIPPLSTNDYTLPKGTGVVTDYRIFTAPFYMGSGATLLKQMEAVLGAYDPYRWRVFALVNGSNIELNSADFANLQIIPGMGFWIISLYDNTVQFQGALAPQNAGYQTKLSTGWHMIALPWPATDVTLGSITVSDGTNTYAITSDSNTLTQTSVWDYTGSGPYSGYEKRQSAAYALQHGVGYFLKVLSASAVTVTIPTTSASATAKGLNATSSNRNDEEPPPGFPCRVSGHSAAASSGRPILPLPPDGLTGLPTCPECSVSMAKRELQNIEFAPGDACECTATESITIGTGVTIKSGANVTFKAPKVNLQSGFSAEKGAVVQIKQE